ncbi:unnamed protein product [Adineta ricciae]|uniref:Aminoglycoside phosphotransferase domain-containing protein n=1 Tax=Adineta ricciae TaxID=249248 RepID=A0A816D351_ADIRI|nr:unnamed protein product [Adineta ricciae]
MRLINQAKDRHDFKELISHAPDEDLVFTHGDYCLPNIIFDDNECRAIGFVDLGCAGIADRYHDIALGLWSIQYNLGDGFREIFLNAAAISYRSYRIDLVRNYRVWLDLERAFQYLKILISRIFFVVHRELQEMIFKLDDFAAIIATHFNLADGHRASGSPILMLCRLLKTKFLSSSKLVGIDEFLFDNDRDSGIFVVE